MMAAAWRLSSDAIPYEARKLALARHGERSVVSADGSRTGALATSTTVSRASSGSFAGRKRIASTWEANDRRLEPSVGGREPYEPISLLREVLRWEPNPSLDGRIEIEVA